MMNMLMQNIKFILQVQVKFYYFSPYLYFLLHSLHHLHP